MTVERFTKVSQLKKMMKEADTVLLECELACLHTALPVAKEAILEKIGEWDTKDVEPMDFVWQAGDPESRTIIIYKN